MPVDALKAVLGNQFADVRTSLITDGAYATRSAAAIQRVIVHHTATAPTTWTNVARYHVQTKGWPGIGYHFGIESSGLVSYLGSIETWRYHAGNANGDSIGVCFMGNFETTDMPTSAALGSYARLLSALEVFLGRRLKVQGHRDVGETVCPGRNLYAVLFEAEAREPLPEDEPLATMGVLAEKVRWWSEEAQRADEAGRHDRADCDGLNPMVPAPRETEHAHDGDVIAKVGSMLGKMEGEA